MNIFSCRHVVRHPDPQCDVHKDESVEKKSRVRVFYPQLLHPESSLLEA